MKQYVTFKIKKIYLYILLFVLVITLCGFGYYKWCASHPEINIQVSESTAGNNLKIEAPQIIYTTRHGIEIAPEIELQIVEIQFQHEGICSLLKEAYQSSDIQLDLSVKNGKTIMHYYGKATTFAGKEENYDIETKLDFMIEFDEVFFQINLL